ncbi:MAG: tetratricopeptide repeat protein [Rhodopirellula sp.]|nr:tetratricopeptide repeat protein [Rhodopirellula sp.]
MRKITAFVASGLCLLLAGCQTPLFSDGLFSSLNPRKKTLTAQNSSADSSQSVNATKPRIGARGWRNVSTSAAEREAQAAATGLNNIGRLREFLAKGNDAMQKGLYDDARIQYETVLSLEPHHATAHHMLGRISDMSKRFGDAERHYLEALSANREDGYLLSDLGYSYLQQGKLDEARQYLTQAITREPDLAIAKVNLAAVYAYAGDQRGALAWLRQVGTEQQAQETLASITSKPAPWIMNGTSETLASSQESYSINKDGQVLDANGQPLTTWDEVQAAMKEIREQGSRKRLAEKQREEFIERQRIDRALAHQRGYDPRSGALNNDANLNQQMQDIEQASGTQERQSPRSGPIYVGPSGQDSRPGPGNSPNQLPSPYYGGTAPNPGGNPQGQNQQYPPAGQQSQFATSPDPYAHLLNPAGPNGFPQQPGYPTQQTPQGPANAQGPTVPPQFPGAPSALSQPPGVLTVPPQLQQPSQQYPQQQQYQQQGGNYGAVPNNGFQQGQPQRFGQAAPGNPPRQQVPSQPPANQVPVDQYGNPIQRYSPENPVWNGPSGYLPPGQGGSAPDPGYFGQSNPQGSVSPQTGMYAGNPQQQQYHAGPASQPEQYPNGNSNYPPHAAAPRNQAPPDHSWNNPQQQPIQQLGFESQRPLAPIVRGQRIPQYSEADRQAMRLGLAAGSGVLSPLDSSQSGGTPSNQPMSGQPMSGQMNGNGMPQNGIPQNSVVPNSGRQTWPDGTPANSGFSYEQSGQFQEQEPQSFQQMPQSFQQEQQSFQQMPDRGYPGAVPATSGQLPGQTGIQAPDRQIPGQSIAAGAGQDPQMDQPWLRMPQSQADVTMPIAFSSSTQPTLQQSQNWQRPGQTGQEWRDADLSSPTTRPEFGQPHMTNPYLRPANTQAGQQADGQGVSTISWGSQQPESGTMRN